MPNGYNVSGRESAYGDKGISTKWLTIVSYLAITYLTFTVVVVVAQSAYKGNHYLTPLLIFCWIGWVTGPPVWFAYEYFYLFKKHAPDHTFEAFKYGQELASRAWLAIAAVLTVLVDKACSAGT